MSYIIPKLRTPTKKRSEKCALCGTVLTLSNQSYYNVPYFVRECVTCSPTPESPEFGAY